MDTSSIIVLLLIMFVLGIPFMFSSKKTVIEDETPFTILERKRADRTTHYVVRHKGKYLVYDTWSSVVNGKYIYGLTDKISNASTFNTIEWADRAIHNYIDNDQTIISTTIVDPAIINHKLKASNGETYNLD